MFLLLSKASLSMNTISATFHVGYACVCVYVYIMCFALTGKVVGLGSWKPLDLPVMEVLLAGTEERDPF